MNINKIKELGVLKEELSQKGKRFGELYLEKKAKYLADAAKDFRTFFEEKEFKVTGSNENLIAKHGETIIELNIPKLEEDYVGAYSIFDFNVKVLNKKEHLIRLNKMGSYPRVTTSVSSVSNKPKTDEEQIDEEIKQTKERIENISTSLQEIGSQKWGFALVDKENRRFGENPPQFESIYKMLEEYFK